jgi:hypothetical protein
MRLLALANALVELAEPEVTVGEKRAHAERLAEGQRLTIVVLCGLYVVTISMRSDVAEEPEGPRFASPPALTTCNIESAPSGAICILEPSQQQLGVAHPNRLHQSPPTYYRLRRLLEELCGIRAAAVKGAQVG